MALDPAIEERIRDAPLSVHLATSVDDRPHVAPVWYGYRDGTVSVLTGGKKLQNVRRNPRVGLSIEQTDGHGGVEWTVTMLGRATVVDDPDHMEEARGWIFDAYDEEGAAEGSDGGSDGGSDEGSDDGGDERSEEGGDEPSDDGGDEPSDDGGDEPSDGASAEATDDIETDGGDDDPSDYALLEIAIGSATLQSYE